MGGQPLSPEFWKSVDKVTYQLTSLLLPIYNLRPNLFDGLGLIHFYQDLHDIVAIAGFTSIAMATDDSIFRIEFPEPGMNWQMDQDHKAGDIWENSKKAADKFDEAEEEANKNNDKWHRSMRMAKVKIVMWPNTTRYQPFKENEEPFGGQGGQRISTILKSQVCYYAGVHGDEAEMNERYSLTDYFEHEVFLNRKIRRVTRDYKIVPIVCALVVLTLVGLFCYLWQKSTNGVTNLILVAWGLLAKLYHSYWHDERLAWIQTICWYGNNIWGLAKLEGQ